MPKRTLVAALLLAAGLAPAEAAKTSLVVGMTIEPPGSIRPLRPVAIREVTWVNLYEGLVRSTATARCSRCSPRAGRFPPDGRSYTFRLQTA